MIALGLGLVALGLWVWMAQRQADMRAAPYRTEAEQAVLDAMRNVNTACLEERATFSGPLGAACRAELARRGLK